MSIEAPSSGSGGGGGSSVSSGGAMGAVEAAPAVSLPSFLAETPTGGGNTMDIQSWPTFSIADATPKDKTVSLTAFQSSNWRTIASSDIPSGGSIEPPVALAQEQTIFLPYVPSHPV